MSNASPLSQRFGIKAWFIIASLLIIIGLVSITAYKTKQIADLQNALQRDWEITYNVDARPSLLPESLDKNIKEFLIDKFDDSSPTATRFNRGYVYHDRFQFLFRGPITRVEIYYPEHFEGDKLGRTLKKIGRLERFLIFDESPSLTAADWKRLCEHLREIPTLTSVELGWEALTDDAISPLAGHPELETLTISWGQITVASAETFKTMTKLKHINIEDIYSSDDTVEGAQTEALADQLRPLLPGVIVFSRH